MRRKIFLSAAGLLTLLTAILVWRMDIPHWRRLDLNLLKRPDTATQVFDASGNAAGTLDGSKPGRWTPLPEVPAHVRLAFIAAEDLRFYQHHGVDFYRMLGALWQDIIKHSYAQGASTITQQLVKLTHLSQAKTLSRKAQEIVLALQLERGLDKDAILEAYLNAVYFGQGAYGIASAAESYFGKTVGALSLSEGALLAGIIKAPSTYSPRRALEKALWRRNHVLDVMAENDMISDAELREARSMAVELVESTDAPRQFAWYMDAVLDEAQAALSLTSEEVLAGNLRIYTALDPGLQRSADAEFSRSDRFPPPSSDGTPVQAAMAVLSPENGEIAALEGGRKYEVLRGLNRATQMRRQPGSAFKPISTYAAAIDAYGYVPASFIDDTPRTFRDGYSPGNAGGGSNGFVTLREALSRSLNIATVDLAETIGIDTVRDYAQRFGIVLSPRDTSLALALGALTEGVSPAGLGAAYCALANGGMRVKAHLIRRIEDDAGRVLYRHIPPVSRAVSPETACMLVDMLKTAACSGSAKSLSACGFPVAGKTGTVSEPSGGTRDIWTAACTPDLVTVIWMGFDRPDAAHSLPDSEGGSGYTARLCADFLKEAADALSQRDFSMPTGVKAVLLDAMTLQDTHAALLSTEKTPRSQILKELFRSDHLPNRFSDNWVTPSAVTDFRCLTRPGEAPALAFTVRNASAEYALLRESAGRTDEIAVLRGVPGQEMRYEDAAHDVRQPAAYTLVPRNANLYARGTLLTGPVPEAVTYAPGGLLNAIMGIGGAEVTPMPMETEDADDQSLFG